MKVKRTYDDFINIILKPMMFTTTDELKWILKHKDSKPYRNLYKAELEKRKERGLVLA